MRMHRQSASMSDIWFGLFDVLYYKQDLWPCIHSSFASLLTLCLQVASWELS